MFEIDSKNYHAWAHRQWVVKTYNQWDGELEFIENLLVKDIRNNSAWNHRWFVVHGSTAPGGNECGVVSIEVLMSELNYTFMKLERAFLNESCWNYLRGIAMYHPLSSIVSEVKSRCELLLTGGYKNSNPESSDDEEDDDEDLNEDVHEGEGKSQKEIHRERKIERRRKNPFAMSLLADLLEMEGSVHSLNQAKLLFLSLMEVDSLRCKAWSRRATSANENAVSLGGV